MSLYTCEGFEVFLHCHPNLTLLFPLNPTQKISNQTGWVFIIGNLSILGLSHIPYDVKDN